MRALDRMARVDRQPVPTPLRAGRSGEAICTDLEDGLVSSSAAEIASGFGALFAGRVMSLGNAQRTMLSGTAISILLIALTPLLGGMLALLLLFQVMRGWLEGVIQPLVLSVQARAAGRHQQGAVVGLRQTGQRFTSIVVPPIMGAIADSSGVSESFLILGGFMLLLCIPLALIIRRVGRRRSLDGSLAGATD